MRKASDKSVIQKILLGLLIGGMVIIVSSTSDSCSTAAVESENMNSIVGDWNGKIEIGSGMSLPIVFHFQQAESAYKGSMESPAQSSKLIEFDEVVLSKEGQVTAKIAKLTAEFKGKLNKETGKLRAPGRKVARPSPCS